MKKNETTIAHKIAAKYTRLAIFIDARENLVRLMTKFKTSRAFTGEFDVFRDKTISAIQSKDLYLPEKIMKTLKHSMKYYRDMMECDAPYKTELYKYGRIYDAHFDEFNEIEHDMINNLPFEIE